MQIEFVAPVLGALIAVVGAATVARWNRQRMREEDDHRAIRMAARELYRELDAATRQLPRMEGAQTYQELFNAMPKFESWPALRKTLADHALERVWMELAYDMDKVVWVRTDLGDDILQGGVRASDPVTAQVRDEAVHAIEEGLRGTAMVLELLLPSRTPARASERLGRRGIDRWDREKLQDRQKTVRRELTTIQAPSPERKSRYGKVYDASMYWRGPRNGPGGS